MLRKIHILLLCLLTHGVASAQYISEVLSYTPAPGQFINSVPWGTPQSAYTLVGGISGSVSLGAFGGSVIFRFEDAVENNPDNPFGVDFSIFGNPMAQWSEPGVVSVMEDENGNGLPDDTWYELAGSDHHFSSTKREFTVTYINPDQSVSADVPWETGEGEEGIIKANSVHLQPYYPLADSFPALDVDAALYTGTCLEGAVDVDHPPLLISARRAFGYADNQVRGSAPYTLPDNPYTPEVENSGGDAFDISWAVDEEGHYVDLERIHFVRVQNGILHQGGYLGEVSTEITGAVDVAPAAGTEGSLDMLVMKDLPPEINDFSLQLEPFLFHAGRPLEGASFKWICSEEWAVVDENHILRVSGTGPLTLTLTVDQEPLLQVSASTMIVEALTSSGTEIQTMAQAGLFPNPARDHFQIRGAGSGPLTLFDASGRILRQLDHYREGSDISSADLESGIYVVKIGSAKSAHFLRLIKR